MYGNNQQQQYPPNVAYQQPGYQQPGYSEPGYAQPGYPQSGYPQPGYPQPGYPQPGYPQPGYPPQPAYQDPGYQQQGYPQQAGYQYPQQEQTSIPVQTFVSGDDNDVAGFDFDDQSIRKGFIRKVYGILMTQLLFTLGIVSLFMFHEPTQKFVRNNPSIWWISLVVLIVTMIAMVCCDSVRRSSPMNFIFLSLFTAAMSFMLGVTTSQYDTMAVMIALGLTAAVTLALTLFAFQTKWDFTTMGGGLLAASVVLIIFGILAIFIRGQIFTLIYASLGAIVFSLYIVYDTQLMMGGKHKYSISPEEYIFAALNLYLDIINLFLYILMIISALKN